MAGLVILYVLLVWWFVFGTASAVAWRHRGGDTFSGFLIGFFFGVFGLGYTLLATPSGVALAEAREEALYRECPYCRERMRRDASVCPHCHRDVAPEVVPTHSTGAHTVIGSTLNLPAAWTNARVETSGEWWRASADQAWRRLPYVDRYGNAWDGANWIPGKRPASERWLDADPPAPIAAAR